MSTKWEKMWACVKNDDYDRLVIDTPVGTAVYVKERKPRHYEPPFAIGDVIEKAVPDKYSRRFEVVGETAAYMRLKCVKGNLSGLRANRSKEVLRRDWKLVKQ